MTGRNHRATDDLITVVDRANEVPAPVWLIVSNLSDAAVRLWLMLATAARDGQGLLQVDTTAAQVGRPWHFHELLQAMTELMAAGAVSEPFDDGRLLLHVDRPIPSAWRMHVDVEGYPWLFKPAGVKA